MKSIQSKYNQLSNTILYSGLGCFSYLFLVIYTDLPERAQADLTSFWAFIVVVLAFNGLGFSLTQITEWLKRNYQHLMGRRKKLVAYYLLIAILLLLLNYLLLFTVKWVIDIPHPWVIRGSGIRMLITIWLVELVVVSLTTANNFYRHIIVLYKKNAALEESSVKARYIALQSQLNPHFLFNSLNALISEIRYNPQNAELFTQHLSDVYRYILQCQEQQLVSLRSELVFLNSYLFLHRVRLGDCIHLDNTIEPHLQEMKIPPLTLQLLAENVIKHNTIHSGKPMTITLHYSDKDLMLVMENEIRPKKSVPPSGTGLKNLAARYQLICDRTISILQEDNRFIVKIPLLNE